MKKNKKSQNSILIILALLIVIVLAAAVYYAVIWKNKNKQVNPAPQPTQQESAGGNQQTPNEIGNKPEKPTITSAQDSINYVQAHLAELSPVKPAAGGSWHIIRLWFATDNDFYVEYGDSHVLRELLIHFDAQTGYGVVGYFEAGENAFELKSGKDTMFGRALVLYEYDQTAKKWERKN